MKTNFKNKKTIMLAVSILLVILLLGVGVYFYFFKKPNKENQITHSPCLSDNEIVDYTINWRQNVSPVDIIIKDKESGKEIYRFTIDSVLPVWRPVQPRKCGVYVLRIFNYNPKDIIKSAKENKYEIWYYSYNGEGKQLLLLERDFSLEFSVDFLEDYLALIRGYLGKIDFATIIKKIKTKEDVFELLLKDIISKHPSLEGNIALIDWTKDSRYFWGHISMGAYVLGFFRIDTRNWNVDIFEAPEGVGGGDALNIEKGYVTQHPGHVWTGDYELTEQIKQEWREQGKISLLYIYNLFTKEQVFVAKTEKPLWFFKPKWISDTELEYEMPNGEKKVYVIEE